MTSIFSTDSVGLGVAQTLFLSLVQATCVHTAGGLDRHSLVYDLDWAISL